jgi:competence protein ComEC
VPALPRAGWLALGAILAALFTGGGDLDLGLPGLLVVATGVGALCLVVLSLARDRAAGAAFLLGLGAVALRAGLGLILAPAGPVMPLPDGRGPWNAEVADVSSPAGDQQRAFLRLSTADADEDAPGEGHWLVYAWLPRHPALVPGDRLTVMGALDAPPADAPGFAGFLVARGAAGTLAAESMERLGAGTGALAAVERLRRNVDEAIGRAIPEPEAGLASGMLVGLRERVSREVADDFTTTGLTHVVAISGWNIALVAGIATGLLRATGLPRRARSLLVLSAIVAYTIVAGAEASVVRAAVMGGVVLLAREGGHPAGAAAALGVACAGLLLADPGMVGDIGLQLSLAATAGLLALGGAFESAVRRLTPERTPGWLAETLGVSLAAQLATLPLILLHFGRLSVISPLANLLMAPIVPLAMLGALLGAIAGLGVGIPLVGPAAALVNLVAWLPLAAMVRSAGLLADVPYASLELAGSLSAVAAGIALLALLAALHRARAQAGSGAVDSGAVITPATGRAAGRGAGPRARRLILGGLGATLVAVIWILPTLGSAAPLRITVLDVGQGDAILVEASDGTRLLVDGGADPDLLVRRLDERIPLWDRRIDLVVLTHPHDDHAGGLAGLVPRYRVGRIADSGLPGDGPGITGLRLAAQRLGISHVSLGQGDAFRMGAARVDVLWPPRDVVAGTAADTAPSSNREVNDTSVVLALSIGTQRALLTGDLETDRDGQLLAAIGETGQPWDLLKVAHHGSAGATSRALLEAIRPRMAAISVGADNDYGHPATELLDRLAEAGATVWRTDQQGTLSVVLDGRG